MAPKRKAPPAKEPSPPPASESEPESEPEPESPPPKKKSAAKSKAKGTKAKAAPQPKPTAEQKTGTPAKKTKAPAKQKKEAKKSKAVPADDASPPDSPQARPATKGVSKVVIEHCKQCQSFKRAAVKMEELLKKSVPDLEVDINPDKPRKGYFEIRDGKGAVLFSIQEKSRPFTQLRAIKFEETAEQVVSKL